MNSDNLYVVFNKFFSHRTETLWHRFPGYYRSLVVETNDPLAMHRVRFKCPDLHDWNLRSQDCPWAVPAFDLGTKRHGRWSHPCIGDWVWVTFERNHPYGPIWVGFADPTRRKFYAYPSIFCRTPLSVNEDGRPQSRPDDYLLPYLPKDSRPMSHGWQDRYGNLDISSSVGFFPVEHVPAPPPPDYDALQKSQFDTTQAPQVNDPDVKHMTRVTKGGIMFIMHDQGYWWKKQGDTGEFNGDFVKDEEFETKRWKYLLQLINDGQPSNYDGRRAGIMTRYGHKIEARDTGWAQPGPKESKSRDGEYGPPVFLSKEEEHDFRWIKLRTKGGHIRQMYDKGSDPQDDEFIKRLLLDEVGDSTEKEHEHWGKKDARQIRDVTRHGFKFVLDDRGSHPSKADSEESPRGNGALLKGRRTGGSKINKDRTGDPRGFYWEFNENDDANHTTWGTPLGMVMEMNDASEYVCLVAGVGRDYAMPWRGLSENEFLRKPTISRNPESKAHHFVLDYQNEYLRLKTRAGNGDPPDDPDINPSDLGPGDLNQGIEARDGRRGDGPWCEVVDSEHRGLWLSKRYGLGIWRAKRGVNMFIAQDDNGHRVILYNDENDGKIQIYCGGNIEVIGGSVSVKSDQDVSVRADGAIRLEAGGTYLTVDSTGISSNRRVRAQEFNGRFPACRSGTGAGTPAPGGRPAAIIQRPTAPNKKEPTDRAARYNIPSEVDDAEIEHPL